MAEVATPRKFILKRIKPTEEIIQKNLEPLKENVKKKERAQEAYYANKDDSGLSPLIRDFRKRPVHQRLGRRLPYTVGTSTVNIPPKMRVRLTGNPSAGRRGRIFTAQQRLNQIRARNRNIVDGFSYATPKKIRLRRALPQRLVGPTNLKVEVTNHNAFTSRQFGQNGYRFKLVLNSQLQHEIKKIQMAFEGGQTILPYPITPAVTSISMHKRFSELV